MLLSIEPDGPVPIYQQIRDRIVEAIAGGGQPAGSGLPSTRQLAVDLGVNFHTVNKSYDLLRQEGLLRLSRGQFMEMVERNEAFAQKIHEREQLYDDRGPS